MTRSKLFPLHRALAILIFGAGLASCGGGGGGGGNNGGGGGGGGGTTTAQEDKFGVQFGKDFRKSALTDDPEPVQNGDIIAIDPTADPVTIQ